ncbi:hypothetical protein BCR39DRAFT_525329 [Naematelia encephala]|uniref:Uncharacterized protein n=1 Tax=Naematelia encephala TaxID=71784 RepID=A0A1Y2BBA6_9TREE|nr:hypothetical protein BCR39DRAFT_525329 [Naematelia encephala]
MREVLGVGAEDPLPPPTNGTTEGYYVPNWTNVADENHNSWIEGIARDIIMAPAPKISPEDLDWHIVLEAAKTSFMNLCKKYIAENDPRLAGRRERYTKGRRRWARKDLKQKKRTRASLDPTFLPSKPLPPTALGMDYMSSEYSSAGEDSDDADKNVREVRRAKWAEMLSSRNKEDEVGREGRGKAGWAEGLGEKVLEVRRARWRSDELNSIYAQLDTITSSAAAQRSVPAALALPSSSGLDLTPRSGHVAPSHTRFIMPLEAMRKGRAPRGDQGEGWMWASGEVGVWLDRHYSTGTVSGQDDDEPDHHHQAETKFGHGEEDEGHPEIDWEAGTMNLVDALVGFGAESGQG